MPSPVSPVRPSSAHHSLPAHEIVLLFGTDPHVGLEEQEVLRRRSEYGPNTLPARSGAGVWRRIGRQIHNPLIYVLLAAGAITVGLGEFVDASVIAAVVVLNGVLGFVQESKAEAALNSLRSMVRTTARVIRGGQASMLPSEDIVPGDLVQLEAGDRVPVDLRLIRSSGLMANESALTGESLPVPKNDMVLPTETPLPDRHNLVYSGTLVAAGSGMGVAVATGAQTELGEIHRLVGTAASLATPLTKKLAQFSRVLTAVILVLGAITFLLALFRGQDPVDTFVAVIALAVGAIPEGLPAAVTIALAIGVTRMARRRVVVRRLPAVETLGSTTVIGTDKTGTLTENQMTVQRIWTPGAVFAVTGAGYAPDGAVHDGAGALVDPAEDQALQWCLRAGVLCNESALTQHNGQWTVAGDPTEGALLVAAGKAGLSLDELRARFRRDAVIPFDSARQYMATLHQDQHTGEHVVVAKGAVERVLELCGAQLDAEGQVRALDTDEALAAVRRLAGAGLRTLATAVQLAASPDEFDEQALPGSMLLTGVMAMHDPPRAAAAGAVAACQEAGISVKMITGDHAETAAVIAERLNLVSEGRERDTSVLTGRDLDTMPDEAYPEAVQRASVFARVSPAQKLRLVRALQDRGHVVAMTGDGVNDAPALRQADIGVAMGRAGTEVAKDAADMVLTDDDFASIEAAVEEGRGAFDNLVKFIVWTLPTNMGEGLVILAAILFGTTLPILPTQILWINMTTAVALGLMLAFEPKEPGIMTRPPRAPAKPLLTSGLIARILLVSALLVAASWWIFQWELGSGTGLAEARTVAVNLFVTVQAFYLFSCRSLTRPAWRMRWLSNRWIVGGVLVQALGQAAITYLPTMNALFDTAPIGADSWLRILLIGAATSLVFAVAKSAQRHRHGVAG